MAIVSTSLTVNCPMDCRINRIIGTPAKTRPTRQLLVNEIPCQRSKADTKEDISTNNKTKGTIRIGEGTFLASVAIKIISNRTNAMPPRIRDFFISFILRYCLHKEKHCSFAPCSVFHFFLEAVAVNPLNFRKLISAYCQSALTDRSRNL